MKIKCVWEHNGNDSLLYSSNYIGAFTRGETKEIALSKMQDEVESYLRWKNDAQDVPTEVVIGQERSSGLDICDADSDVLFEEERHPLSMQEYLELKELALKSAKDFLKLYESIPDKHSSALTEKKTFLGPRPRTAHEMYEHTKSVNTYYFGGFLNNTVMQGSYDEEWSLRKVLRRFIWHDRIHAKAMYRMALKTFAGAEIPDIFRFES